MRILKKALCCLLALSMLLPTLGAVSFASEDMYTFFADDFESGKLGSTPATGSELHQWNSKAASAQSYAKLVSAEGGQVLEFGRVADVTDSGGPRYEKKLPTGGVKVRVLLDVKTNGNSFGLYLKDSDTNKKILDMTDKVTAEKPVSFDKNAFVPVVLELDFAKKLYSVTVNGTTVTANKAIDGGIDLSEMVLRVGTNLAPGQTVQIDNVVMLVNDKSYSADALQAESEQKKEQMLGGASEAIVKQRKTPDNFFALFTYDFEKDKVGGGISVGTQSGKWHAKAASDIATLTVAKDGENQVAEFGRPADQAGKGYPRLEQKYGFTKKHIVTVEYDVRTNGQQASLELHDTNKSTKLFTLTDVYSLEPSVKIDSANYVHVYALLDFTKMTYDVTIGDKKVTSGAQIRSDLNFDEPIGLRFNNGIDPGYYVRLDNVFIGINDEEIAGGNNKSIRDMTTTGEGEIVRAGLRAQHPRLHIRDFDSLKQEILADPLKSEWYDSVLASAQIYLQKGHFVYNVQSGGVGDNILEISRQVMHMAYTLSFAYKMTGNPAFKDRLYAEFVAVGAFPDWSIEEFLATAEMCHAFAVGYDWLYEDWTVQERENILHLMTKQGLDYAVENYNGAPTGGTNWVKATHNWNLVCNGSMLIAAMAIADEAPQYADFFFEQAAASIQNGLSPYAPMGAYPEGAGYWAYGTNYLTYTMSAMEAAFADGVPAMLSFYDTPGIDETCDFLIYTNAYTGRFNYGDASASMGGSPILYWFADRFDKPQYTWYMLQQEASATYSAGDGSWTNVLKMIWYNPAQSSATAQFALDKAYKHEGEGFNGAFLRSSWTDKNGVYIGLQGGYNRDNHMFLSQGNFLLEADGERWSTMRGSGNYGWSGYFNRGTNTSQRWTYYKCRAEGQNTLVLNPGLDADQEVDSVARLLAYEHSDKESYAILDMTDAYKRFGATSVKRGVRLFDNRSRVLLSDEIYMNAPLASGYWFMHTDAQVQFLEDKKAVMLTQNGKKLYARIIEGPENAVFSIMPAEPLPTSPNPTSQASVQYGNKLAIELSGHQNINLTVEFIPLGGIKAVPADDSQVRKLADYKIVDTTPSAGVLAGNAVGLFVDSPKAFNRDCVTYVDTANAEVKPLVQNGRTLLPVRFVAEKFGARVGWDEVSQTVTVNGNGKLISLVIGSNVMTVNGEQVILDVPAQTIHARTLIPLRALAEALGKTVYWDDRGLILISDAPTNYAPETVDALVDLLANRIYVDGKEVVLGYGQKQYDVYVSAALTTPPQITASSAYAQPAIQGNAVTIGNSTFAFNFISDPTTYASGELALGNVQSGVAGEVMEGLGDIQYLVPVSITAQAPGNTAPENALDNDISTQWTLSGEQWLCYDFGAEKQMTHFSIAVMKGAERVYNFKIQASSDGVTWKDVYTDGKTEKRDDLPTLYAFGAPVVARYVRYLGSGNTTNNWNSVNELRFYENTEKAHLDARYWETIFSGIPTYTYGVGVSKQLVFEVKRNNGQTIADGVAVACHTSDASVVTVTETGLLTTVGKGRAEITLKANYYGIEKEAKIKIVVE